MSLNREQRRRMKKALGPLAKDIAMLEKRLKASDNPVEREVLEREIERIMSELSLMEMMAIEDLITSKGLIDK